MKVGDEVTWDSPSRGPVQAKLVKYLEPTNTWTVEVKRGWATVYAIAKPQHLRTAVRSEGTPCPCGDPGDCADCGAA